VAIVAQLAKEIASPMCRNTAEKVRMQRGYLKKKEREKDGGEKGCVWKKGGEWEAKKSDDYEVKRGEVRGKQKGI